MAKNIEPYVSSIEQVTILGSNSVQSTSNRVLCMFPADCGPTSPTEINSQSEFLATYTDGSEISRKSHIAFLHALKASQSLPLMCVRVCADKTTKGITDKGTKVYTKGDVILDHKISSPAKITCGKETANWVIAVDEYLFVATPAKGGAAHVALSEGLSTVEIESQGNEWPSSGTEEDLSYFMTKVDSYLTKYANCSLQWSVDKEMTLTITNYLANKVSSIKHFRFKAEVSHPTEVATVLDQEIGEYNFVVSPNYPCKDDIFGIDITDVITKEKNSTTYYQFALHITLKGDTSTYYLSTYPDDNDSSGNNMYLTSANELTTDFTIIPHKDDQELAAIEDLAFGKGDDNTVFPVDSLPLNLLSQGIADIEELEGVHISLVFDCGITMPAYQKKLAMLAEYLKALAVLSCPQDPLPAKAIQHINNVAYDGSYAWMGYPWVVDRSLVSFPVELAPGCYYLERLAANASGNAEFAPIFGKATGIASAKNLKANVKLQVRNELQAAHINPIHYNKTDNKCYFTNNLTMLSQLNVLQEEQTRRIVNKIRYEVDLLCGSYLSYDWDLDTCDKITEAIKNYFDKQILTLMRTIDSAPEVSVSLAGLNKVKVNVAVKPKGSVKYISVYYNILSVAA